MAFFAIRSIFQRPHPTLWRCNYLHNFVAAPKTPRISVAQLLHPRANNSDVDPWQNHGEIVLCGYIHSVRKQKERCFAAVMDGSSRETLQALLTPEQAKGLSHGTAVRLTGSWRPSPNPTGQSHELFVSNLDVVGPTDSSYPIQKKYQTNEYLRKMPHLRVRIPFNSTLLRLRSEVIANVTKTLSQMFFIQTHTPIITSSDCEGAGDVFQVDSVSGVRQSGSHKQNFFRSPKYLAVSSQLHLEALSQAVGNVWTLSPAFRGEKSDTSRHLSEFYMLEVEMSFVESLHEVMKSIQSILLPVVGHLYGGPMRDELLRGKGTLGEKELRRRWDGIINNDWKCITYEEAIRILQSSTTSSFEYRPEWGQGLQAEHERYIVNAVGESTDYTSPVFVTHFPRALKPFYMLSSESGHERGRETVECFDLLVPEIGEIAGGSMREHRLQALIESMFTKGMIKNISPSDEDLGNLKWYVDLRKWGSVPHGGFGLGFDRFLSYLAGVSHIREIVTFPRWVGRCDC